MKNIPALFFVILFLTLLNTAPAICDDSTPVVFLIQAKGEVLYSTDGFEWKLVNRNKFLYDGWEIKTGIDGSCKLIDRETELVQTINSNSRIKIDNDGVIVIKGSVSSSKKGENLFGFLKRKFTVVQKYMTVKRAVNKEPEKDLKTIRKITLSKDYPELVWENLGHEFSYQIVIDKKTIGVNPTTSDIVRCNIDPLSPGNHFYYVKVLYKGEVIYMPRRKGTIKWLSDEECRKIREAERKSRLIAPDNGLVTGNILDEHGLKVAAMDHYIEFLKKNPDVNEARPFLIKIYNELKLKKRSNKEAALYNKIASSVK